ncbi:unnamed protein product [Phytophthora lilii]|uniref:Unnamed protein product n=1 Tax=Phytophthora lilii TaxID=2077276 RepID=A0A9W6UAL7_9STRA|nr:unnamed protein product [Phytophthora lilii]
MCRGRVPAACVGIFIQVKVGSSKPPSQSHEGLLLLATRQFLTVATLMRSLALAVLLVAALASFGARAEVASQSAPSPNGIGDTTVSAETLVSDVGAGRRALQALTSIAKAKVGSKTFALVDSYDCDNGMRLSDVPYTGVVPDAKTVTGLVNSNDCMGIITAVVLLNMPPCKLNDLPMRAACEALLYYSVALQNGVDAPTAEQFDEVMTWRRDVNLARAANKPFDGKSETYATFTKALRKALSTSKVTVMNNFTVVLDDEEADSIEMKDYFVGKVVAASNGFDDAPVAAATISKSVTTEASGAASVATSTTVVMALAIAATLV